MSKSISLVGSSPLASFATSLIGKVTKNAVKVSPASSASAGTVVALAPEASYPAGVHTAVATAKGTGPYTGVKTTVVRAVLPKKGDEDVALRDVLDVLSGTPLDSETAEITSSFKKSAAEVATLAKSLSAPKVVLALKQVSAHEATNTVFVDTVKEVLEKAGLAVEVSTTAQVTNQLLLFPETVPVVFTNDTPSGELLEKAFAGVTGAAALQLKSASGTAYGGYSPSSTAAAVAASLKEQGFSGEAAAVEKALGSAKPEQLGADILSGV